MSVDDGDACCVASKGDSLGVAMSHGVYGDGETRGRMGEEEGESESSR